jgi:hypothetical protein
VVRALGRPELVQDLDPRADRCQNHVRCRRGIGVEEVVSGDRVRAGIAGGAGIRGAQVNLDPLITDRDIVIERVGKRQIDERVLRLVSVGLRSECEVDGSLLALVICCAKRQCRGEQLRLLPTTIGLLKDRRDVRLGRLAVVCVLLECCLNLIERISRGPTRGNQGSLVVQEDWVFASEVRRVARKRVDGGGEVVRKQVLGLRLRRSGISGGGACVYIRIA